MMLDTTELDSAFSSRVARCTGPDHSSDRSLSGPFELGLANNYKLWKARSTAFAQTMLSGWLVAMIETYQGRRLEMLVGRALVSHTGSSIFV